MTCNTAWRRPAGGMRPSASARIASFPNTRNTTKTLCMPRHDLNRVPFMLTLGKFSIGVGDRFAHQAKGQLRACMMAADAGATVIPVWNKSNREHAIVGSEPAGARAAADQAVQQLGWTLPSHVAADLSNLNPLHRFIEACAFYTLPVPSAIVSPPPPP